MSKKPWGVGAWAADAERAEAEEKEQAAAAAATAGDSQSFPSLRDAVTTKQKKKTKMSLQEFAMHGGLASAGAAIQGLTPDEMRRLPTGPKERSPEEMQSRLGGGFSSYGRSTGGPPGRMRDGDGGDTVWGNNRRSYDDDRRGPPPRVSDYEKHSRADEVDNWAIGKKSSPAFDTGRPNRYSSLGGGGISKADESDNWGVGKKPLPSTFASGFRDSGPERPRLVLDPRRSDVAVIETVNSNKPNPFGAARPREEILADKGLDWRKIDMEIEVKKSSRPTSSHSSRPQSAESAGSIDEAMKPRPKVNPFGEAKPREVLLQEKGLDWRKIDLDLEHRHRVERAETEAEKKLKEEIEYLKKEVALEDEESRSLKGSRERELEVLRGELDDKVKLKGNERLPSPSRPRSRGSGDMRGRQRGNGRRTFSTGRETGFLDNRDFGRSNSRERW